MKSIIMVVILLFGCLSPEQKALNMATSGATSCNVESDYASESEIAIVGYTSLHGMRKLQDRNSNYLLISLDKKIHRVPRRLVSYKERNDSLKDLLEVVELQEKICGSVTKDFLKRHRYYREKIEVYQKYYNIKYEKSGIERKLIELDTVDFQMNLAEYNKDKAELDKLKSMASPHTPDYYILSGNIQSKGDPFTVFGVAVSKRDGAYGKCTVLQGLYRVTNCKPDEITKVAHIFSGNKMICLNEQTNLFGCSSSIKKHRSVESYEAFAKKFEEKYRDKNIKHQAYQIKKLSNKNQELEEKIKEMEPSLMPDMKLIKIAFPNIDDI